MVLLALIASAALRSCTEAAPYEMFCRQTTCDIDEPVTLNCTVFHSTSCRGNRTFFLHDVPCRFCFQVAEAQITCDECTDCRPSISIFTARCQSHAHCMGPSIFERRVQCTRTAKSQKTAILLSLFLGGFGADRFYLGHYLTGAFKLVTFGGLGIAYMIDLFLIAMGFLGPAGGSLYPERL